ncbi:hypothetical protein SAMN04488543_2816 [Friedmanniella luteola]|uniref:MinD-like ATPase involved in chromosome partitioning or flagellar assembly n=1 Tax=Friedmanniella luteola TaxID=546871 RepID=A0A1H1WSS1_9ACTN|nr:hypothetical protein [Friedmanniella luteola]SDT00124.1 hypothetical protein SAMN04488543_2816 [Friedmanniella luteola]
MAELRRAWEAVADGQFQIPSSIDASASPQQRKALWTPKDGERVVTVAGCVGSCGASTVALALASTADGPARVVECCPSTASGLAAATTAELGVKPSGWAEGTRGDVIIQRTSSGVIRPEDVPSPPSGDQLALTVLDAGWRTEQLLDTICWLTDQIRGDAPAVAVAVATVPGLRQLEVVLSALGPVAVAAVVGPAYRRWPTALKGSRGAGLRRLEAAGRLVVVPHDRRLALHGLDSTPLPAPLLEAARQIHSLLAAGEGNQR